MNIETSNYDEALSVSPRLHWLPWLGKNYGNQPGNPKILLVGESHYSGEGDKDVEKHKKNDFTRIVVDEMGSDGYQWRSRFFVNAVKYFHGEEPEYTKSVSDNGGKKYILKGNPTFWDNVAFYNFIQRPMANPKARPNKEDVILASEVFLHVIKTIKPTTVIFLNLGGAKAILRSELCKQYPSFKIGTHSSPIAKHWTPFGEIHTGAPDPTKLLFVRHPSSFVGPGIRQEWNSYLKEKIPEEMTWIENLKVCNAS